MNEGKCNHLMEKMQNTNEYDRVGFKSYEEHIAKCSKCKKFFRSDYRFRWEEDNSDPYLCQNDTPTLYYHEITIDSLLELLFERYKENELVIQWINKFNDNDLKNALAKRYELTDEELEDLNLKNYGKYRIY